VPADLDKSYFRQTRHISALKHQWILCSHDGM